MKIGPVDSSDQPVRPDESNKRITEAQPEQTSSRKSEDAVQISDDGRRLSEDAKNVEGESSASGVDDAEIRQEKVDLARQRLESGYYEKSEVKEKISRRITDEFLG